MFLKRVFLFIIAPAILLMLLFAGARVGIAAHNGRDAGDTYTPITFPQLSAADTLTSVDVRGLIGVVEVQCVARSIRYAGWTAGTDSGYYRLAKSLDDSNYVNVSSEGTTEKISAAGVYTITYDLVKSTNFLRIEVPRV
ncbi:MAG: hypothetical protein NUV49_01495, partial [Patescibacteria group bacterium]|nr:hypothetical protein [Patescibacteria group bacterium]